MIRANDIVQAIHYYRKPLALKVFFKTGIMEKFFCDGRPKLKSRIGRILVHSSTTFSKDIKIYDQYEKDPLNSEPESDYHKIIYRSDWEQASVPEQRIAFHRFLLHLLQIKEMPDNYPLRQRKADFLALKNDRPARYMHAGKFYAYPANSTARTPWRRLMEHYFPLTPKFDDITLYKALFKLANKKTLDISTYEARKKASILVGTSRAYNPVAYCALLERLKVEDSVIDLHPDIGHKAVACALLGLKYICQRTPTFERAVSRGFCDDIGLYHEWYDCQSAHTIISDNNFYKFNIEEALHIADKAKMLIAFANPGERLVTAATYNPTQTIIMMTSRRKQPGYVMVW